MRPRPTGRLLAAAAALLVAAPVAALSAPAVASPNEPSRIERLKSSVTARTGAAAFPPFEFGNDVFRVFLQADRDTPGVGTFTVQTGPKHPAGAGHDVLFGNGSPGTSYLIVRHLHNEQVTDYVQGDLLTHSTEVSLDPRFNEFRQLGTTGIEVGWGTPFGQLTQHVEVHGTTPADSSVEVTTKIQGAPDDDLVQIQYLWDVALGDDDGPALQPQAANTVFRPFAPIVTNERTLPLDNDNLALVDNDANPVSPSLAIGVTASGPGWVRPAPIKPASQKYVCWPQAIYAPIDGYETDDSYDVSTPDSSCTNTNQKNDSAVVTLWAVETSSTEPITVSASLFTAPRIQHATELALERASLSEPAFTATLRDTAAGRGVAGRTVSFSAKGSRDVRCTAVTDANGVARCGSTADGIAAVLAGGYTATFGGDAIWAATSATR